jgi:hypothetical protein
LQYAERLERCNADAIAERVGSRRRRGDDGRAVHEKPVRHGDRSDLASSISSAS